MKVKGVFEYFVSDYLKTRITKHRTQNTKHQTPNTEHRTRNTKHETRNRLPDKIMMTFHPQRWNDSFVPWLSELVSQKVKNQVKRVLVAISSR